MDYNQITSFLDKFKKIIFQKEETRKIVGEVISEEISHPVDENTLRIKTPIVYVVGSPILKSEILIHRNRILEKLNTRIPNNKITDIK